MLFKIEKEKILLICVFLIFVLDPDKNRKNFEIRLKNLT
jgi:hypothetical protein